MFTINQLGPVEACLPQEASMSYFWHPAFHGVAWPGESKDKVVCKSADHFLQFPETNNNAIFTTPIPGVGDRPHRSVWHVKVEGETQTSVPSKSAIIHSENSGKDYLALDYKGWTFYRRGYFDPTGEDDYLCTEFWFKVEYFTDLYAFVRAVILERNKNYWNPYTTGHIAYWCFPKYDITLADPERLANIIWDERSRDYVKMPGMKDCEELFDVDFTDSKEPPVLVTADDIPLETDIRWPEMKAYVEENGVQQYADNSAYEYIHTGRSTQSIISQAELLSSFLFTFDESFDTYRTFNEGVACNRALARSYCNDGNAYEFWKDVPKFGAEVKDITKVLRQVGDKVDLKNLSKAYLSTHYGTQLTISDYTEWSKAMTEWMWRDRDDHCRRCGERMNYSVPSPYLGLDDGECTLTYALYYDPHWDKRSLKQLGSELGFDLSGQHVWELVPFSFVADWFHNYSEDLKAVHAGSRLLELDTYGEEVSEKYTFPITDVNGLSITYYRRIAKRVPTTYPIAEESNTGQWKTHWLEGAALILSH